MPIKILLPLQHRLTGMQYYRQLIPHQRLLRTTEDIEITALKGGLTEDGKTYEPPLDSLSNETLSKFDIVYFLRQVSFNKRKYEKDIERLHGLGLKVILDIDDYWHLPDSHILKPQYKAEGVPEQVTETINLVDYVITTNNIFSEIISKINPNVMVIPNCISPDDAQFTPREIPSPLTRIGWIGGVYHYTDMLLIERSIKKLYATDLKFQLCFGGFNPNPEFLKIEKLLTNDYCFGASDKNYYDYLKTMTPLMEHTSTFKPYRRLWGKPVNEYGDMYNNVDICLAPLISNTFNNCKSELKLLEAGWMGKPVICSDTPAYRAVIRHGENGFIVTAMMDWFDYMEYFIENPLEAKRMGLELQKTIKEKFDIDLWNTKRMELYKALA